MMDIFFFIWTWTSFPISKSLSLKFPKKIQLICGPIPRAFVKCLSIVRLVGCIVCAKEYFSKALIKLAQAWAIYLCRSKIKRCFASNFIKQYLNTIHYFHLLNVKTLLSFVKIISLYKFFHATLDMLPNQLPNLNDRLRSWYFNQSLVSACIDSNRFSKLPILCVLRQQFDVRQ